jgi:hypothetical protein
LSEVRVTRYSADNLIPACVVLIKVAFQTTRVRTIPLSVTQIGASARAPRRLQAELIDVCGYQHRFEKQQYKGDLMPINYPNLIAAIDAEIATLVRARTLLVTVASTRTGGRKRKLSAESRAKIAAAQKKRWAEWKRTGKR